MQNGLEDELRRDSLDGESPAPQVVEIDPRVLVELLHWAKIGLENGYEIAKSLGIDAAELAHREAGLAFTLSDLHEASRSVRESAETVREALERPERSTGALASMAGGGHALPEIVVDTLCTTCEEDVDPLTGRHLLDVDICLHEKVPGRLLDVRFTCPACGGGAISEVNIGEIWDEVTSVDLDGTLLTVTVDQLSEMDRSGDGWICTTCLARLALPSGYEIAFEYD